MYEELREQVLSMGANAAAVTAVSEISFEPAFRKMCESNACGNYGKSYMCPPDIGTVEELIEEAKGYQYAFVYQTVGELEDRYDFEGMMLAGKIHNDLAQKIRGLSFPDHGKKPLFLGAGGCRLCQVCGKKTGEPCRHPEDAMSSLEAYGMNVSELAKLCGMRYINGANTVTYFGVVLF